MNTCDDFLLECGVILVYPCESFANRTHEGTVTHSRCQKMRGSTDMNDTIEIYNIEYKRLTRDGATAS